MVQYSPELSKDGMGQKTTAVPINQVPTAEWTTPVHLSGASVGYDVQEDAFGIRSTQKKFRDSFSAAAVDATKWASTIGAGATITQAAGILTMGAGVTANSETFIESKETFTVPFRAMFGVAMSQRIINQEFFLELVSCDAAGVVDGRHVAAWKLDATTVTQGKYQVGSGGLARLESGVVTISTTAAYAIKEIECFADETWFHDRAMDSTAGRSASWVRHQQIPDPTSLYKVRIRVKNGATAPASNTNLTMQYCTVIDYAELTTEITASRGAAAAGMSMPVQVANVPGVTVSSGTVTANFGSNMAIGLNTPTALAANALYTSAVIDGGTTIAYNGLRIVTSHTAGLTPGHLILEQSIDNVTWRETHRIPVPSDGMHRTYELPWMMRYLRVKFQNGATAQTAFFLNTSYSRVEGQIDSDKTIPFIHSTTALAAAGAFTGTTLDLGANHSVNRHRATVFADQPGTLYLEQSRDGTIWRVTSSVDVTANVTALDEEFVLSRYVRVRYVNGATANTTFELLSALIKN